jgi:hypothetical protein
MISNLNSTSINSTENSNEYKKSNNKNNGCKITAKYSNQSVNSYDSDPDCFVNKNNQKIIETNVIAEDIESNDIDQSVINESDEAKFDNLFLTDSISYFKKV